MNILMCPDWRKGNPYQTLLADALSQQGANVTFSDHPQHTYFKLNALRKRNPNTKIIHLHWLNTYIEDAIWDTSLTFWLRYALIWLDITYCRMKGVAAVWTVHNLISHESNQTKNELRIRKMVASRVNHLTCHSQSAKNLVAKTYNVNPNKIFVMPHGNYKQSYQSNTELTAKIRKRHNFSDKDIVILFIGNIRRYKGVDHLIETFSKTGNTRLKLLIAGRVFDPTDQSWLDQAAQHTQNLTLDLRFIPENEIAATVQAADIVALPYTQTLSSGAVMLALSFGRPMLLSESAKIFDIPGNKGAYYYKNAAELKLAMEKLNKEELTKMARYNQQFSENYDWRDIAADLYQNLYSKL